MKTQKTKSWKGHWVAVHPDLTSDPAGMKGQLGKVQRIDEQGDVWVNFSGEDYTAKYAKDALLALAPKSAMLSAISSNSTGLEAQAKIRVYEIFAAIVKRDYHGALQQAMSSEETQASCLMSFDKYVEMIERKRNEQNLHQRKSI